MFTRLPALSGVVTDLQKDGTKTLGREPTADAGSAVSATRKDGVHLNTSTASAEPLTYTDAVLRARALSPTQGPASPEATQGEGADNTLVADPAADRAAELYENKTESQLRLEEERKALGPVLDQD